MAQRYLILSDIHLTVPHPWAAFRDQEALGAMLEAGAQEPPFTLVLAGDTFDFLMLEGYEGFDAEASPDRLARILEHPENAAVLAGLRAVAAKHQVVLLAGNHDPEVLLPSVRARFAELIGCAEADLGAEELLHTPEGKAPIWGLRVQSGAKEAWVVHGDRWDISNHIDREAFRRRAVAGEAIELPAGSRLVYRVIRRLKGEGYNWVDQVKPEIESVIPLLLYLDWDLAWKVVKEEWRVTANLLVGLLRHKVGMTNLGGRQSPARALRSPRSCARCSTRSERPLRRTSGRTSCARSRRRSTSRRHTARRGRSRATEVSGGGSSGPG